MVLSASFCRTILLLIQVFICEEIIQHLLSSKRIDVISITREQFSLFLITFPCFLVFCLVFERHLLLFQYTLIFWCCISLRNFTKGCIFLQYFIIHNTTQCSFNDKQWPCMTGGKISPNYYTFINVFNN